MLRPLWHRKGTTRRCGRNTPRSSRCGTCSRHRRCSRRRPTFSCARTRTCSAIYSWPTRRRRRCVVWPTCCRRRRRGPGVRLPFSKRRMKSWRQQQRDSKKLPWPSPMRRMAGRPRVMLGRRRRMRRTPCRPLYGSAGRDAAKSRQTRWGYRLLSRSHVHWGHTQNVFEPPPPMMIPDTLCICTVQRRTIAPHPLTLELRGLHSEWNPTSLSSGPAAVAFFLLGCCLLLKQLGLLHECMNGSQGMGSRRQLLDSGEGAPRPPPSWYASFASTGSLAECGVCGGISKSAHHHWQRSPTPPPPNTM
eukprot:Sspe_Gene.62725::Locus_35412_Transcript_4_5_Confidence_0.286_Length_1956::g.62725::m.62725